MIIRDPSFSDYLGGPSTQKKKNLQRSQFFPLSWWSFPQKVSPEIPVFPTTLGVLPPKKIKNSQEIPAFPTILGVLPPQKKNLQRSQFFPLFWGSFFKNKKKFSRDPSFSHYLGVPSPPHKKNLQRSQFFPLSWGFFSKKKNHQKSQFFLLSGGPSPQKNLQRSQFFPLSWWSFPPPQKKNLQRSQFFPLSWWSFPQKVSPEIPVFPTILGVLPQKNFSRDPSFSHWGSFPPPPKKKISRNPTFSHYFGGPSPKTFSRDPTFSHYLGGPPPKKKKNQKDIRAGADSALRRLVPV